MRLKKGSASNRSMASKQRAPEEEFSAIDKIEESVIDEEFEEMKGEIQRATKEAEELKAEMDRAKGETPSARKQKPFGDKLAVPVM